MARKPPSGGFFLCGICVLLAFVGPVRYTEIMKRLSVLVLLAIIPALIFCQDSDYVTITPTEAHAMLEKGAPLLLDVRTPGEYALQYVPGSVLIPLNQLPSRLEEIDDYKNRDVLVLCRSGNRSRAASQILVDTGFTNVYNIDRGIIGWTLDGFPVTYGE